MTVVGTTSIGTNLVRFWDGGLGTVLFVWNQISAPGETGREEVDEMRMRLAIWVAALFSATTFGDDVSARANLMGTWQLENGADKDAGSVWVLENKGDALHIAYSENDRQVADFECNTMGRECEGKDAGREAKISLWFSGPKLVQLETRGSEVVKRRFAASQPGDSMEIEVIPIVPDGKKQVLKLKRLHPTTATAHQ